MDEQLHRKILKLLDQEIEASNWNGYVVPAATPRPVVARLNEELKRR